MDKNGLAFYPGPVLAPTADGSALKDELKRVVSMVGPNVFDSRLSVFKLILFPLQPSFLT